MLLRPSRRLLRATAPAAGLSYSFEFVDRISDRYPSIADASQTGLDLQDFTFEIHVKWSSLPPNTNDRTWMFMKNLQTRFSLKRDNAALLSWRADIRSSSGYDVVSWTTAVAAMSLDTWYHLALTCDVSQSIGSQHELFIDTVSQGNGVALLNSNVSTVQDTANPFNVGSAIGGTEVRHAGKMADPRVWNDVRTSTEIAGNWKARLAGNEAGLVSNWQGDEGTGSTAADSNTTSGNDMGLTNVGWSTDVPY